MASNSFGKILRFTTWGESHGKAIGVVLDGCPAGLEIDAEEINLALALRAPGKTAYTSPRTETDKVEILSGVFEGKTTGTPISLLIPNKDVDSSKYSTIRDLLRPGHANYTYLQKYGIFDFRGGGRSSARETACRVAAGAIAKKFLQTQNILVTAFITQIGTVRANVSMEDYHALHSRTYASQVYCPDPRASLEMAELIEVTKVKGDSLGGIIEFRAFGVPEGLGDPVYDKLEANLAHAMMGLPAAKGFELGSGFDCVSMLGSEHNDLFIEEKGKIKTRTNYAGGTLGGISTGMPIQGRVAFKPTSSIMKRQDTMNISGERASLELPEGSRHDPCVAIRAVPIVEAMVALVLADAVLMNRCVKL